jgi:hypothetical protein
MKKFLNLSSFVLFIVGTIFKLESWPGANILILIGSLTLLIGAIYIGYTENQENGLSVVHNFVATLTLATIIVGGVFKFMHWPGGQIILIASALLALAMVMLNFLESQPLQKLSAQFVTTILLMLFISTALGTKYSTKHTEKEQNCKENCEKCDSKDSSNQKATNTVDSTQK